METVRYRNLILGRDIGYGVDEQHHVTLFALKDSRSLYCVDSSTSPIIINYFSRLWGVGIPRAIFTMLVLFLDRCFHFKTEDCILF